MCRRKVAIEHLKPFGAFELIRRPNLLFGPPPLSRVVG